MGVLLHVLTMYAHSRGIQQPGALAGPTPRQAAPWQGTNTLTLSNSKARDEERFLFQIKSPQKSSVIHGANQKSY